MYTLNGLSFQNLDTIFFNHLKSDLQRVRISNISGYRMVKFKIPSINEETRKGETWHLHTTDNFLRVIH